MIQHPDISIVVQGPVDLQFTPRCLESVRSVFPVSPIILSTWKNSDVEPLRQYDIKTVFNKDPGCKPRGESPSSKPNNVNRQIVSARNGIKEVKTNYALKLRSDFILFSDNFLKEFGKYNQYEESYRVFKQRVIVCMFGTRKAVGVHYNLPYHVSDFCSFGMTEDLDNLYDIPLVADDEFDYHKIHKHIKSETYSVNRYNAEQSIIINFLRKNGKAINCEFSTDTSPEIAESSARYVVNNFIPLSFRRYGVCPMKEHLLPFNNIEKYTDYITFNEWLSMYGKFCQPEIDIAYQDVERAIIDKCTHRLNRIKVLRRKIKSLPVGFKGIGSWIVGKLELHERQSFARKF